MPTQQALYADLAERSFDPELSWAEHELPERLRTKHVHRLHPYLGKFVPQLVERFLERHFRPGQRILDPFAGSGTTLVVAKKLGRRWAGFELSANYAARIQARLDAAAEGDPLKGAEDPKTSAPPTPARNGNRRRSKKAAPKPDLWDKTDG